MAPFTANKQPSARVCRDAMDAPRLPAPATSQTRPAGLPPQPAPASLESTLSLQSCWFDLDLSQAIERELLDTTAATHATASDDEDDLALLSSLLLAQAGPGQGADPTADLLRRQQEEQHRRQQRQRRRAALQELVDSLSLPQLEQALAMVKSRQHQHATALAAASATAPPQCQAACSSSGSDGLSLLHAMVAAPSADSMLQAVSSYFEQLEGRECEAGLEQVSNLLADPQQAEVAGALGSSLHAAQAAPAQAQAQQLCSSLHAALAAPQVAAAASALRSRVAAAAEEQRRRSASRKRSRSPADGASSSSGSLVSRAPGPAAMGCGLLPHRAQAGPTPLHRSQPLPDWSPVDSAASAQAAMGAARSRAAMLQARVAKRARMCVAGDAAIAIRSQAGPSLALGGDDSQSRLQQACVAELQRRMAAQQRFY